MRTSITRTQGGQLLSALCNLLGTWRTLLCPLLHPLLYLPVLLITLTACGTLGERGEMAERAESGEMRESGGARGVDPAAVSATECMAPRPTICTMEYRPVCATLVTDREKTYASGCNACADVAVASHRPNACDTD